MGNSITTTTVIREIPLNKLVPSKDNVRRTGRDNGIGELAASLLAHGVLQNLTVRPALDDKNRETGKFEVTAGGRRLAALKLLVKHKMIAKTTPVTCNVREDGSGRELSLVENVYRENLHPADQFDAFRALHEEEGLGAEEIAARFGVTVRTVRERLKLAAVSPKLLAKYRDGDLTLDQIMAFAVIDDRARQEEVWEGLSYDKSPHFIRRCLLQGHMPAQDKRAMFVGLDVYEAAGGGVLRDLFAADDGGYLTDPALLERLARTKLEVAAESIKQEGWKWVDVALDFPHGHGLRRVYPRDVELAEADLHRLEEIEAVLDQLSAESEAAEESDPEREAKIAALNAEYDAIDAKGRVFEPEDVARAGAIVSIDHDGDIAVVRGLVRHEDEPTAVPKVDDQKGESGDDNEGDDRDKPSGLPDRLVADLSAHLTMAMRDRLGAFPEMAQIALTHALALQAFYCGERSESCLNILSSSVSLEDHAPGIGDSAAARSIAARHEAWAARMPKAGGDLWGFVLALAVSERSTFLAHCVSLLISAVQRGGETRGSAAETLATELDLDMRSYWTPTAANYFTRVSKAFIQQAVREGMSHEASERIASLKKPEMAQAAEQLLAATPWLPDVLKLQRKRDEPRPGAEQSNAAE